MLKKIQEIRKHIYLCIIYTFCRGYIHHFGYNREILNTKRSIDYLGNSVIYKILSKVV